MRSTLRRAAAGRDLGAERDALGHRQADAEWTWHVDPFEVLTEMPQDVGVIAAGREDVDEAEELGLEARMGHRPVEHALAPAPEVEEVRLFGCPGSGDLARERLDVVLEARVRRRGRGAPSTDYRAPRDVLKPPPATRGADAIFAFAVVARRPPC
jgi:hypothetical protein